MYLGDSVFISYRNSYYKQAQKVKTWLENNNYCKYAILYPPKTVFVKDQLITPFQFFQLLGHIQYGNRNGLRGSAQIGSHGDRGLTDADAFVILNTEDYALSSFTQAEMMLWKVKNKEAYSIFIESDKLNFDGTVELPYFSSNEEIRELEVQLGMSAYRASNLYKGKTPDYFGKYSRSCFLLSCPACENHFLASIKSVCEAEKGKIELACPHCENDDFYFTKSDGCYQVHHNINCDGFIEPLPIDALVRLLVKNDLPDFVGLVTLCGEVLKSDGRLVAEGMFKLLAGLVVGMSLLDLFFGEKD